MAPANGAGAVLLSVRAGTGDATRVSPACARRYQPDRQVGDQQKVGARPGGREAPAVGGAGAGRGLWPPAGMGSAWRCGKSDGPGQRDRTFRNAQERLSGREKETRPAFPPPVRDGALRTGGSRHHERPAPDPAGAKCPPWAGRAPAGGCGHRQTCGTRSAGPGRWPRPDRVRRAQAEKLPVRQPEAHAAGISSGACLDAGLKGGG